MRYSTVPYYAVIFPSKKSDNLSGYEEINKVIYDEAEKIEGYLGFECGTLENGEGIHISYWKTMEAIHEWKNNKLHQFAKQQGMKKWYNAYNIKICKVEYENEFIS